MVDLILPDDPLRDGIELRLMRSLAGSDTSTSSEVRLCQGARPTGSARYRHPLMHLVEQLGHVPHVENVGGHRSVPLSIAIGPLDRLIHMAMESVTLPSCASTALRTASMNWSDASMMRSLSSVLWCSGRTMPWMSRLKSIHGNEP
jgi:hypothetical protein